jgi:hypothetical protein
MSTNSFIPPKMNYPLLWLSELTLNPLLKTVHNIDKIIVSDYDRAILKSLRNQRLIYIANHPSTQDPPIAFWVANQMSTRFNYMASREVFDWGSGMVGSIIQSIGAYSVIAGTGDRESLKMTREILSKPGGKLALFPEGEPTSNLNDTLLPFQPGMIQLGFWGLEDALKIDPDARIFILPVYSKYRLNQSTNALRKELDKSLEKIEDKLGINKIGKTIVQRFFSIGKRILETSEKEFNVDVDYSKDYFYRLGRVRHEILNIIAEKTKIKKWNPDDHSIDKIRKILATLELVSIGSPDPKNELPDKATAKWARLAIQRCYDYIAFTPEYLIEHPSAERLFEYLWRFEQDVFGSTKYRPHNVNLRVIEPLLLNDYYEDYKKDKKGEVDRLTKLLRDKMEKIMKEESDKTEVLFPPDFVFNANSIL